MIVDIINNIIIIENVELRIKIDLYLGQKVEEEEDFHVIKISSLSTKAISTTKLDQGVGPVPRPYHVI